MSPSSIKIALFLTSAPVMVAAAMAWGSPAMAVPPTSVPAPLPVFGALSALGFSRALRQRIQKHQANTNQIN